MKQQFLSTNAKYNISKDSTNTDKGERAQKDKKAKNLLEFLKNDPDAGLASLYDQYFRFTCNTAYKIIGDYYTAQDITQEVFVKIWKKRDSIDINTSLEAYLRRATVNHTLNHIRAKKIKFSEEESISFPDPSVSPQMKMEGEDLQLYINMAIDRLPNRCRIIFALSRFESMTYKQIATKLKISPKTVENQMSKALKLLRKAVILYQTDKSD